MSDPSSIPGIFDKDDFRSIYSFRTDEFFQTWIHVSPVLANAPEENDNGGVTNGLEENKKK